ncbi:MAG: PAS domain-containing sensor histidine kinase, partial [Cyanobacteria bacterium J06576_12]
GQSPANSYGASIEQVMGEAYYEKNHPYIEAVLAGKQVSYESELTFQDGRSHSVSVAYVPHIETNQAGKRQVKGFFALTTDISDRKAIERMKDEFIAVVSHELRTPLTSIHTSLKLLATGQLGSLSEDGQQMLEVADENTDRLVRLVNNVLDLQRIESGDVTLDTHACSGAQLLEQAAEAMTTMAQQHNIHLKTHTEPLSIWADPDYIIRTLTNLIGNAIKFSEPGTVIHLTVQSSPLQQSFAKPSKQQSNKQQSDEQKHPPSKAPQALFCVEDQGQGIPSDKLTQIFERFQQVDSSDSRKKGGTGLGLTICRKIIEQHGGRIWADSQIGVGSRFYFTVPLNPPTNLTPAASTKTERQAISIANSPSQLTYTEGL